MSKVSKTARASMAQTVGQKVVIPDEVYIKNLRYDVNNGIHATQEGAKALLRGYDAQFETIKTLAEATKGLLKRAEDAETRAAELEAEITKIKETLSGPSATEVEARNNHD